MDRTLFALIIYHIFLVGLMVVWEQWLVLLLFSVVWLLFSLDGLRGEWKKQKKKRTKKG